MKNKFKFIDLFAGIGGFHQAMKKFGGECVFASEIDKDAIKVYKDNYDIDANNDIVKANPDEIPPHDVLCGGFPCQAFSKAGEQNGLNDTRGTLFFEIQKILTKHKTKIIILENVRNLTTHDEGNTWKVIEENLIALGYRLTEDPLILSPHYFGIPHLRDRVFIVGIHDPDNVNKKIKLKFDKYKLKSENKMTDILDSNKVDNSKYNISEYEEMVLNIWDEFYQGISQKVIGFPIWSKYFNSENIEDSSIPEWKKNFINKNKELYEDNKNFIDDWLIKHNNLDELVKTHRKFEWQAGNEINSLWEGIIQFRPSGIRVKRPDVFPSLVAMVQIPIIGTLKRRLSPRECARLQSFPDDFQISAIDQEAYKQFGNSLNVKIVEIIYTKLLRYMEDEKNAK